MYRYYTKNRQKLSMPDGAISIASGNALAATNNDNADSIINNCSLLSGEITGVSACT